MRAHITEEEFAEMLKNNPQLAKMNPGAKAKPAFVVASQSSHDMKIKYGEKFDSLAGSNWLLVLKLACLEGLLGIFGIAGITLGLGFILMGCIHLSGWESTGGGALLCLGIISGLGTMKLHERI